MNKKIFLLNKLMNNLINNSFFFVFNKFVHISTNLKEFGMLKDYNKHVIILIFWIFSASTNR